MLSTNSVPILNSHTGDLVRYISIHGQINFVTPQKDSSLLDENLQGNNYHQEFNVMSNTHALSNDF